MLLEVVGGTVSIECRRIPVLLVDDDGVRIAIHGMGNIADAARFEARGWNKGAQRFLNLVAVFGFEFEANGEADHCNLNFLFDKNADNFLLRLRAHAKLLRRRAGPWSARG